LDPSALYLISQDSRFYKWEFPLLLLYMEWNIRLKYLCLV